MAEPNRLRTKYVIGPDGTAVDAWRICRRPTTQRWVIRRKAEVVAAVRGGLLVAGRGVQPLYIDRR